MTEIPREFICPVTFEIMEDPVICSDGYTYERKVILNLPNSISPLTRQQIDKNNLIPNRNLKDAIERYKSLSDSSLSKKLSNISKLEKFELEQKIKKQEMEDKIKKELLEKQKRDNEEFLRKQKEKEKDIQLKRILEMFNAQNTALFNYGDFSVYNFSMNQFRNMSYDYTDKGKKKYIFTIEMLKLILNENKEILSKKYDKITNDYIWVKKYVFGEGLNPLIEFVFDNFIPEIDNLIEKESQIIVNNTKEIKELLSRRSGYTCDNADYLTNQNYKLEKKLNLITKIKNKQLKSKEYYIVNNDEFCKDFEITEFLKKINISIFFLRYDWNILYDWIIMKKQKFNNLIENIFNIFDECIDKINYITYNYHQITGHGGSSSNNSNNIHIISMYNLVIQSYTQPSSVNNSNEREDIIKDYEPIFFEPLMNLTKNIIELIDFLQEEM